MDKISIFGLLLGLVAILGGQVFEGGHISSLLQPTAMLIVLPDRTLPSQIIASCCLSSGSFHHVRVCTCFPEN